MARLLRHLTHPQVIQDPDIPVQKWHLSDQGKQRLEACDCCTAFANTGKIVASTETKAIETAEIIASVLGIDFQVRDNMHENDRSATGYLRPELFEQTADEFFNSPEQSTKGWERAVDAQARIVAQTEAVLRTSTHDAVLLIGHGAVGTLLFCHFAGHPINRSYDQPAGGGNVFSVNADTGEVIHAWKPIEQL